MARPIRGDGNPSEDAVPEGGAFNTHPTATNLNLNINNTHFNDNHTQTDSTRSSSTTSSNLNTHKFRQPSQHNAREWKRRRAEGNATDHTFQTTTANITIDEQLAQDEIREHTRWHVPRVGTIPAERPANTFRFMSGQLNSMCSHAIRDRKLRQIEEIIEKWDVQAGCFQEVGINWSSLPRQEQMTSWFRHHKSSFATTTSHNTNESLGQ